MEGDNLQERKKEPDRLRRLFKNTDLGDQIMEFSGVLGAATAGIGWVGSIAAGYFLIPENEPDKYGALHIIALWGFFGWVYVGAAVGGVGAGIGYTIDKIFNREYYKELKEQQEYMKQLESERFRGRIKNLMKKQGKF